MYSKTAVKANRVDKLYRFPLIYPCKMPDKELFELSIGISLEFLVTLIKVTVPGLLAQSVTCLATDVCLTTDPGVVSSIPARSHTFVEIDHEIKFVHELLVNRLFKPAQEKVWLGGLTVPP